MSHQANSMLIWSAAILLILGLVALISASAALGERYYEDAFYYLKRQIKQGVFLGIIIFFICFFVNYNFWRKIAFFLLIINIILMLLAFLPFFQVEGVSARRWVALGPISFQPSEFLKVSYILFLASFLSSYSTTEIKKRKSAIKIYLIFIFTLVLICGILVFQPATGTVIIISLTSMIVYLARGAPWRYIILTVILAFIVLWLLIKITPARLERIISFFHPQLDPLGKGYQLQQALIGIGSGGLFGVGFGKSVQKFHYLPESHTDVIFSIIAEETGFIGVFILLIIFMIFILAGFQIAQNAADNFGYLLGTGLISWIAVQVIINIAANCQLIPMTGIPLPFISYGSSALITTLASVGILANIAKY